MSEETIYRSIFIQARGSLKKELASCLARFDARKASNDHRDAMAAMISERPATAEDRAVPGHWEADLMPGCRNSRIAILTERHTRFVMLAPLDGTAPGTIAAALTESARRLPLALRQALSQGFNKAAADYRDFSLANDIDVYFCNPRQPWLKGHNENISGLLRQYFPDGTDVSIFTQAELDIVARKLNQRPRQTLNFQTPAERLSQLVAQTR